MVGAGKTVAGDVLVDPEGAVPLMEHLTERSRAASSRRRDSPASRRRRASLVVVAESGKRFPADLVDSRDRPATRDRPGQGCRSRDRAAWWHRCRRADADVRSAHLVCRRRSRSAGCADWSGNGAAAGGSRESAGPCGGRVHRRARDAAFAACRLPRWSVCWA